MNVYKVKSVEETLRGNAYPGRGIIIGTTPDGKKAMTAYFIMGRSANSRNRVFTEHDGDIFTEPFDPSKVEDPSLIIYAAIRKVGNSLVVTNGDQTDTIRDFLVKGESFEDALMTREFEPDAPNFTPRISGILDFEENNFSYRMSILKSGDEKGSFCNRFFYRYQPSGGIGHFIHTYVCDGNPLPTFQGEPERIKIEQNIDVMTDLLWGNLDSENCISLIVRYIDLETQEEDTRMINRNK